MQAKYWQHSGGELLPKSHVLVREGSIFAHVGIWPVACSGLNGAHVIDWFADPDCHGAGTELRETVTRPFDFLYSLGSVNKAVTSRLLRHGYSPAGYATTFARPLRPFRQIRLHQRRNWKLLPRLLRNFWWSKTPPAPVTTGFTLERRTSGFNTSRRSADYYSFLASLPGADLLTFDVQRDGARIGGFALLVVGHQARVVKISVESRDPEVWAAALYLSQQAALEHSEACELLLRSGSALAMEGALRAGFRKMGTESILYRGKLLPDGQAPIDFQLGDNDQLILYGSSEPDFLT